MIPHDDVEARPETSSFPSGHTAAAMGFATAAIGVGSALLVHHAPRLVLGAVSGALAGAIFKQVWKVIGHEQDAPDATDRERGWWEVVIAAAVQGAIFAGVKAAVDRGGAVTVQRLTGTWPD